MSEPHANPHSSNELLDHLHLIDPQLASLKAEFSHLARWDVSPRVRRDYLALLTARLQSVTAMLVGAGDQYMALVVGGGGCVDKMDTIEEGLWSLRREYDGVLEGLGRVERRLGVEEKGFRVV